MLMSLTVINNENASMCSQCKGQCCKNMPGIYSAEQFEKFSEEELTKLLASGDYAIDWWEDDEPTYYLRPRIKNESAIHGSWGGECINLTSTGCKLSYDKRPYGCQQLIPNYQNNIASCYSIGLTKKQQIDTWKPYQKIFKTVIENY